MKDIQKIPKFIFCYFLSFVGIIQASFPNGQHFVRAHESLITEYLNP